MREIEVRAFGLDAARRLVDIHPDATSRPATTSAVHALSGLAFTVPVAVAAAIAFGVQFYSQWARSLPLTFAHWDALNYIWLAVHGYPAHPVGRDAFFPGYPMLVRGGMAVFDDPVKAGLAVSVGSALLASWLMLRWARFELGDGDAATLATWLMVALPGAFFMFAAYSEAPFVAAAIACLYFARTGRFGWSVLAAAIACAIRLPAVALGVAMLAEVIRQRAWTRLPVLALIPLPVAAYFAYLGWHTGDWFAYLHAEAGPDFGIHFVWPWQGAWASWTSAGPRLDSIFRTGVVAGAIGAVAVVGAIASRRLPLSLGLYCAAILFVSMAESNWRSMVRYELALFPLTLPLAAWGVKRLNARAALIAVGVAVLAFTAQLYGVGGWVG